MIIRKSEKTKKQKTKPVLLIIKYNGTHLSRWILQKQNNVLKDIKSVYKSATLKKVSVKN